MVRDPYRRKHGDDSDTQQNALRNNDQDMTLEDSFKFIEAKEAGKRQHATIQNQSAARFSSYKQADKVNCYFKAKIAGSHATTTVAMNK